MATPNIFKDIYEQQKTANQSFANSFSGTKNRLVRKAPTEPKSYSNPFSSIKNAISGVVKSPQVQNKRASIFGGTPAPLAAPTTSMSILPAGMSVARPSDLQRKPNMTPLSTPSIAQNPARKSIIPPAPVVNNESRMTSSVGASGYTANDQAVKDLVAKGLSVDAAIGTLESNPPAPVAPTVQTATVPEQPSNTVPWNQLTPEEQQWALNQGYAQGTSIYVPPDDTSTPAVGGDALAKMQAEAAAAFGGSAANNGGTSNASTGGNTSIKDALAGFNSPEEIKSALASSTSAINDKYDAEANNIQEAVENQRMASFSDLAGVGANPLSSGGTSIGSASSSTLNKLLESNERMRRAEIASAEAVALGQNNEAAQRQLDQARLDQKTLIDQEAQDYQRRRDSLADSISVLNATVNAQKEGRVASSDEKKNAQDQIKNLFETVGSGAFDQVSDEDLRALEEQAGMAFGSIRSSARSLKAKEGSARKTQLTEADGRRILIDATTGEQIADIGDTSSPLDVAKYNLEVQKANQTATGSKALSAEAAKTVANADSGLKDIQTLREFNQSRFGSGRFLNPQYKAAEANLVDVIGRLRSGGAITTDEEDRFMSLLPSLLESDATRETKLQRLESMLADVKSKIQPNIEDTTGGGDEADPLYLGFKKVGGDTNLADEKVKPKVIAESWVDPNTKDDVECVIYARTFAPGLPKMPYSDTSKTYNEQVKRSKINSSVPTKGAVAIMPKIGFYGHVAGVKEKHSDGTITIREANYVDGKITERRGTPEELGIEGYWTANA